LEPKPSGHRQRKLLGLHDTLRQIVKAGPDLTREQIIERLPVKVAASTLSEEFERLGITFKKRR
jgi:transposase